MQGVMHMCNCAFESRVYLLEAQFDSRVAEMTNSDLAEKSLLLKLANHNRLKSQRDFRKG